MRRGFFPWETRRSPTISSKVVIRTCGKFYLIHHEDNCRKHLATEDIENLKDPSVIVLNKTILLKKLSLN
mgnify:CR=1 FL=1